jgi:hypothetical protein
MYWFHLEQDEKCCRAVVNTVTNLAVPGADDKFLINLTTISRMIRSVESVLLVSVSGNLSRFTINLEQIHFHPP